MASIPHNQPSRLNEPYRFKPELQELSAAFDAMNIPVSETTAHDLKRGIITQIYNGIYPLRKYNPEGVREYKFTREGGEITATFYNEGCKEEEKVCALEVMYTAPAPLFARIKHAAVAGIASSLMTGFYCDQSSEAPFWPTILTGGVLGTILGIRNHSRSCSKYRVEWRPNGVFTYEKATGGNTRGTHFNQIERSRVNQDARLVRSTL